MNLLSGKRFGRLIVLEEAERTRSPKGVSIRVWKCMCDCGNILNVRQASLSTGNTTSCGCFHKERLREVGLSFATHGHSRRKGGQASPTYKSWDAMLYRCSCPSSKDWDNYGGRGIKVCKRWLKFENFLRDMGERPQKTTLDRINVNKGYTPKNCAWNTSKQQGGHIRANVFLTWGGRQLHVAEVARLNHVNPSTLMGFIRNNGKDAAVRRLKLIGFPKV